MNCHKSLDFAPSIHVEIDGQKLDKIINQYFTQFFKILWNCSC